MGEPPPSSGPAGATNPWTELPQGQDIQVTKGYAYAAFAKLLGSIQQADITKFLSGKGLTVIDYAEQGQRPGIPTDPDPSYKTVVMMTAFATADGGTIPWGPVGAFKQAAASLAGTPVGSSQAEHVWAMPQSAAQPPAPPAAPSTTSAGTVLLVLGGLAGAGGLAWWLVHRHKHKAKP